MNVNQHAPMASPYGQPHPGYGQPSYPPLDGGYPAPYAPYNGPASAYQPGAPQPGWFFRMCSRHRHFSPLSFLFLPSSLLFATFLLLLYSRLFRFHQLSL